MLPASIVTLSVVLCLLTSVGVYMANIAMGTKSDEYWPVLTPGFGEFGRHMKQRGKSPVFFWTIVTFYCLNFGVAVWGALCQVPILLGP